MSDLSWTFTTESKAEQQLLAITIILLDLLRKHAHLTLFVPIQVHEKLDSKHYGLILFDTLSAEHLELDSRLQLRVHPHKNFKIEISS